MGQDVVAAGKGIAGDRHLRGNDDPCALSGGLPNKGKECLAISLRLFMPDIGMQERQFQGMHACL